MCYFSTTLLRHSFVVASLSLFWGGARRDSGAEEGDDGGVALTLCCLKRSFVIPAAD